MFIILKITLHPSKVLSRDRPCCKKRNGVTLKYFDCSDKFPTLFNIIIISSSSGGGGGGGGGDGGSIISLKSSNSPDH